MSTSWNWPGSRWWRIDLHTHSPASHDFKPEADRTNPDWPQWVEAVRDAGLDAAAITDHNTAAGIAELQEAAAGLDDAPVLFPGVEVTASDGVHLLLLMDPNCSHQHIDDLLTRVEIPVEQRGHQTARSSLSVEQILERCGDDALIVGAHVNGPDGLLGLEGQQRLAVLQHRNLAAVEVNPDKEIDERWLDGSIPEIRRTFSRVWSSDGHSMAALGRRFTWVKMTRPDLEGLRLALLDGPDSIKPAVREAPGNPNTHAALAIERIIVKKARFIGRQSQVTVRFNPWLNAMIGGRGTGKSTLIDFCRKALRREAELDGSDRSEEGSLRTLFDRRMRVPESRLDEGLLTKETRIGVVYRKDDERFLLVWSLNATEPSITRLDGDKRIPEEGDIRERFPVRIYSQKQLFALAQDPNALLTVIDDSQVVLKAELDRQIDQLAARYLSLRAESRAASRQAADLPGRRALLVDVRHKLEVLERGGQAQVLNKYRRLRQQNDTWDAIREAAVQAVESVGRSAEDLSVADLDLGTAAEDDSAQASLIRAHEKLRQAVDELRIAVRDRVGQARRTVAEIDEGEDAVRWRAAVEASEREFEEATAQLAKEGISDPSEYNNLLEWAASLEREIEALKKEQHRAEALDKVAVETLTEYREQRSELSQRRGRFATETSSDVIRVAIEPFANRGRLAEGLAEILGIERFESDRQVIARKIQPEQGRPWSWEKLDGVVAEARQLLSGELNSWPAQDHRFEAALKAVPPERIDRLALYLPDDAVEVSFKDRAARSWQPLTQGSPGQQTAALLAFVLGYGSEPIILDQPEDDLDNTLIYELLVSRLRETKTKRQVIVVTHNPNIVVHGDAELVLSLKAAKGQSSIDCQGGLQERGVRDVICSVMEGGREAFESRYKRIIPPGSSAP